MAGENAQLLDPLIDNLRSGSTQVRERAAEALLFGLMRAANRVDYAPALIDALSDPQPRIRMMVAMALGCTKSDQALVALYAAAQDTDPMVRCAVANALTQIEDPRSIDVLAKLSADPELEVMATATSGLCRLAPEHEAVRRNLDSLITILDDSRRDAAGATMSAAMALGQIGGERAHDALLRCLRSRDPLCRHHALMGLGMNPPERALGPAVRALKDKQMLVRAMAIHVVQQLDPPDLEQFLEPLLRDPDEHVRMSAALSLYRKGHSGAIAIIDAADESCDVRKRRWAKAAKTSAR